MGAAESVPGRPVASAGSGAGISYGIDRERAISEAGLNAAFPLSEPHTAYGPLSGIWLSAYTYRSSGRDATFTGRHSPCSCRPGTT